MEIKYMKNSLLKINGFSPAKKLFARFIIAILLLFLLTAFILSLYAGIVYYIKKVGINLSASQNYEVNIKEYFHICPDCGERL
jgi:hypothetical protein